MQHQGAGPDPHVNSADEVKQKAARGSTGPEGAAGRNAADSTDHASQTAIPSDSVLDEEKGFAGCTFTHPALNLHAGPAKLIHFSSLQQEASAARPSSEAAVRGE